MRGFWPTICSLAKDLGVLLLCLLHESNGVNGVFAKLGPICLESVDFFLNIVLEQIAISLLVARCKSSELRLKKLLVEDLCESDTASLHLVQ